MLFKLKVHFTRQLYQRVKRYLRKIFRLENKLWSQTHSRTTNSPENPTRIGYWWRNNFVCTSQTHRILVGNALGKNYVFKKKQCSILSYLPRIQPSLECFQVVTRRQPGNRVIRARGNQTYSFSGFAGFCSCRIAKLPRNPLHRNLWKFRNFEIFFTLLTNNLTFKHTGVR